MCQWELAITLTLYGMHDVILLVPSASVMAKTMLDSTILRHLVQCFGPLGDSWGIQHQFFLTNLENLGMALLYWIMDLLPYLTYPVAHTGPPSSRHWGRWLMCSLTLSRVNLGEIESHLLVLSVNKIRIHL
jgi:hypothetical protein